MKRQIIPDVVSGEQELFCMEPHLSGGHAARAMAERRVAAALVMDGDQLLGILTERDLVFRVMAKGLDPEKTPIKDIMTPKPITVSSSDHASVALERMRKGHFRHLPVIDDGVVKGIVSIRDLYETVAQNLEEELHNAEALIYGEQYGGLSA